MINYRNEVRTKDEFGGPYEELRFIGKLSMSGDQDVYVITPKGWTYLHERGISEDDFINSRKTVKEFCIENSLVESEHYHSGIHAIKILKDEKEKKEKEKSKKRRVTFGKKYKNDAFNPPGRGLQKS